MPYPQKIIKKIKGRMSEKKTEKSLNFKIPALGREPINKYAFLRESISAASSLEFINPVRELAIDVSQPATYENIGMKGGKKKKLREFKKSSKYAYRSNHTSSNIQATIT